VIVIVIIVVEVLLSGAAVFVFCRRARRLPSLTRASNGHSRANEDVVRDLGREQSTDGLFARSVSELAQIHDNDCAFTTAYEDVSTDIGRE
jgi:hypothetical protein